MKKYLVLLILCISNISSAQITFQQVYWTVHGDMMQSLKPTSDSGYVMIGGMFNYTIQSSDGYVIKANIIGDTVWTRIIGGFGDDWGIDVLQTNDNGFLVCGITDGFGAGGYDWYIVKLDVDGNLLWSKTYGGPGDDEILAAALTNDGGAIVSGFINNFGTGVDIYLVKLDAAGDTLWAKSYGSIGDETGNSVQQTFDGGYVVCGTMLNSTTNSHEIFVIKTDSMGTIEWTRNYGGLLSEAGECIQQTPDGGYIVAGWSSSFSSTNWAYLVRIDINGDTLWSKTYSGLINHNNYFHSVGLVADGGFILGGVTENFSAGAEDYLAMKTDSSGNIIWSNTYGGTSSEYAYGIYQVYDGGFILGGMGSSFIPSGGNNYYLVKTDRIGNSNCNNQNAPLTTTSQVTNYAVPVFNVTTPAITITNPATLVNSGASVSNVSVLCRITSLEPDPEPGSEMNVYPNPSAGRFTLRMDHPVSKATVEVITELGSIMFDEEIDRVSEIDLSLENLPGGIYVIKVTEGDKLNLKKIIIQDR